MRYKFTRRIFLRQSAATAGAMAFAGCQIFKSPGPKMKIFDVRDFGARGDSTTLDTLAIQRAIDAASAAGTPNARAQVLLRGSGGGGQTYLTGTLRLKSHIDFHLADDARLLVSANQADYHNQNAVQAEGFEGAEAALTAHDAVNLQLTGTGTIDGRSPEFMERYDEPNEWWIPKPFRPRLLVLTNCRDLEIRNLRFLNAPIWTVHLIGCQSALIDSIRIQNQLDVPNCDGIDPDHCRDVEIKNCHITCGDDAIVIKTTRQPTDYGICENIRVSDCILETQDAGLKIGTETTRDIRNLTFQRCKIITSSRGIGIQLRDEGHISNITFKDITFTSRYYSAPWWGRGESISLTAIPRAAGGKVGTLSNIHFQNITGTSENSLRIDGTAQSPIQNITLDNLHLTLRRWTDPTKYPGAVFDNRPTRSQIDLEPHNTPAIFLRNTNQISLTNSSITWSPNPPDTFTHALQAENSPNITHPNFTSPSAHPERDVPIAIS